jgi:hypothetical protein
MSHSVQQKQGNNPRLWLNVAESATFRAMRLDLKPISPKLLHEIQHSPALARKLWKMLHFSQGSSPHVTHTPLR